jgi:hypothetical protein
MTLNNGILCQLQEERCIDDDDCGDGYNCGLYGNCECDASNRSDCGTSCELDSDCPVPFECDHITKRCFDRDWCSINFHCPAGTYCGENNETYTSHYKTCQTGTKSNGDRCTQNTECMSGECHYGSCFESCRIDSDCPSDALCVADADSSYCYSGTSCPVTCPPGTRCAGGACAGATCRSSGDCDDQDCTQFNPGYHSMGECMLGSEGINLCKPNEWRTSPETPFCFTNQECDLDTHCNGGSTCETIPTRGRFKSYCARRVSPRQ